MSKNIFDETKTILENIGIDFDEHGYVPTIPSHRDSDLHFYTIYKKDIDQINEALEQAQKQKELLEYYIELVETIEILERDYNYGLFKFNGIKYTYNKIKELEK